MEKLKCLYYEDSKDQFEKYGPWVKSAWDNLDSGVEMEIKWINDFNEAREALNNHSSTYHLLVADVFQGSEPLGLELMTIAKKKNSKMAILALTVGAPEPYKDIRTNATKAGADEYILKSELSDHTITSDDLGEILRNILKTHGYEPIRSESIRLRCYDEDDIHLKAVIEKITDEVIKVLAYKIFPKSLDEIVLSYIQPGLSGAYVLRIECHFIDTKKRNKTILLKVSRDKFQLEAEAAKHDDATSFPNRLFIPLIKNDVVDSEIEDIHRGWYAIAYDFQSNASTLLDWLIIKKPLQDKIQDTLKLLFLDDGLKEEYNNSEYKVDMRPNVALWNILTLWRRATVQLALNDLLPLANIKFNNIVNKELLLPFIESKRILELDEIKIPFGTYISHIHGDLHGRNILVDEHGRPYLIDPANITFQHWASDIARFIVDLVVTGWDNGYKSHLWDSDCINEWVKLCSEVIGLEIKAIKCDRDPNGRIKIAVSWLLENLPQIFEKIWSDKIIWEFQLALGIEFFRASYRQELPAPKRVLGLAASCIALKACFDKFNECNK